MLADRSGAGEDLVWMEMTMNNEELRKFYEPDKVKILFVGESPPAGKTFFYTGNSNLFRATLAGFQLAFPEIARDDFFRSFEEMGCYLVDLCDQPVNKLTNPEKKKISQAGIPILGQVIRDLKPEVILVVSKSILPYVEQAQALSTSTAPLHALPFPAMGHQREYTQRLMRLLLNYEALLSPAGTPVGQNPPLE